MQNGRGEPVVPTKTSLELAKRLLENVAIHDVDQPTGTTWSVLPIVTPDGLVKHFVEISSLDPRVDVRGPQNTSGQKHCRCEEE
eukprot:jgi/Botrbrau1/3061/Bobra.0070s0054.1